MAPDDTTSAAERPRHPGGHRIVYPGNLVGTVDAPGDSEAMKELLQGMTAGREVKSIGHYDGSVSLFPEAGFVVYLNAHPTDDRWTVHGFVNGGAEDVAAAAAEPTQMFDSVRIRTELAYLPEDCAGDAAPHDG